MVALAPHYLKWLRDEQTKERAKLDQMLAQLVPREIDNNEDPVPDVCPRSHITVTGECP